MQLTEQGRFSQNALVLIFNTHLPYVKQHADGLGKLEERWLFDALVWSYIPFIETIKDMDEKNLSFSIGVSLSPTLIAMLQDEFLMKNFEQYLEYSIILGEKEHKRLKNINTSDAYKCITLAARYRDHFLAIKHFYSEVYKKDILAQWRDLSSRGCVELLTTSATYAFLPNFRNSKEIIHTQIKNGLLVFKESMGFEAKGFWLPECGYYEGIEHILEDYGIAYSFCDTKAVLYADRAPRYGIFNPVKSNNDVLFFPRDGALSDSVWSSKKGYMMHDSYRDFYKDAGNNVSLDYLTSSTHIKNVRLMTGYKYYGIHSTGDDGEEYIYDEVQAKKQLQYDIQDYVEKINARFESLKNIGVRDSMVVQLFDLDLFGQRWYEGLDWLDTIIERIIIDTPIQVCSPSQYLKNKDTTHYDKISLSFSSWSEKGYAQVWVDDNNKLLNRDIYRCIILFKKMIQQTTIETGEKRNLLDRIIKQAGREILLAQSSDWPFILHANKLTNYAYSEVYDHLKNFHILYQMIISKKIHFTFVHGLECQNKICANFDFTIFDTIHI